VISVTDRKTTLRYVRHCLALIQMFTCNLLRREVMRREVMSEVRELPLSREVRSEARELIDTELDAVCGAVSDLGKYITKAVDDAISAISA
jgi:hypothetical protein